MFIAYMDLAKDLRYMAQVMRGTAARVDTGCGFDRDMKNKAGILEDQAVNAVRWAEELEAEHASQVFP